MNLTNYLGGISVNPSEVTLRFDGSYEFLKQNIFQHFNFDVYRKIMNDPKVLLEVMQKMANEVKKKFIFIAVFLLVCHRQVKLNGIYTKI